MISWRKRGVLVSVDTWSGVAAEPVIVENAALFGP